MARRVRPKDGRQKGKGKKRVVGAHKYRNSPETKIWERMVAQ